MSSIIKVDQIQNTAGGTPTAADLGLDVTGSILQVKSSYLNFTQTTSTSWADVTNLSVNITPKSASSTFLIHVTFGALNSWGAGRERTASMRILRNGGELPIKPATDGSRRGVMARTGSGESDGNHPRPASFSVVDSPATTSQITYKVQVQGEFGASSTVYINRSVNYTDTSDTYGDRTISTITVYEIAG